MATGDGGFALSFAQEQLWFLDQLRSGAATEYLLHRAYRLRGPLDVEALTAALTATVARHEVLRTRYDTVDGMTVQVIDEQAAIALSEVDITGTSEADWDRRVHEIGSADLRAPIDLRTQPPWRLTLVRLSPTDSVLLFAVHHIAFDGWSWGVLLSELSAQYEAITAGTTPELPELPVQYADYADWQRQWWDSSADTLRRQLDFWTGRLAGLTPLDLPTDRPRPATWDAAGDSVDFHLPADLVASLTSVGRASGATPFMVYLAAFQLLLSRYARRDDIAVGVSVARRDQVELENLIGLFLNTIVLRADLSADPSFTDLLARVRDTTLDAYGNQDVPFERVVAELAPERDLSRNPVFQVGFALHSAATKPFGLTGLSVEIFKKPWTSSAFDLSLHIIERPDGSVMGQLLYPTALFDRARIERMAANLTHLLTRVAETPNAPVSSLDIVADDESRRVEAWSRPHLVKRDSSLPELFRAQAMSTPDAVAVVSGAEETTYADLAGRVATLADYLQARGVGAENPVGVAMGRGTDLAVALLAVLSAGGVYIPLPVDYPADRLALMVADAGIDLILTEDAARTRIPAHVDTVALDSEWTAVATAEPARRPSLRDRDAAYILYTSGSTGRPKGVVITHEGIRNRVLWSVERYGMTAADRVLQKTTIGFDAAMWEFLSPLVSGGTVVMAPAEAHRDPAAMLAAVADHGVTMLQVVPSILRLLVEEPSLARCRSLRLVCSAGEALPAALCAKLRETVDVEVVNTYGPTECSIDATAWTYAPEATGETVPIGTPLPNLRVFVVDGQDRQAPIGVPGELCVSGVGLARGYAGRGDLTAERFTPNPFAQTPGERWYRTGDLARWTAEGVLEFAGRVDDQVKVRGVRIEPAEIEAAIRTHPSVGAAVVTTHRSGSGELELVAYAVPSNGSPVRPDLLREHLADRLPAMMVPSTIIALDALPLTPNGKLDRAALPDPSGSRPTETAVIKPRTETERAVAELMAELLDTGEIGADADFFALGGHSLLAIRLVMRLRRTFGVEFGVAELFAERTVANLAALIDRDTAGRASAITPVAHDRDLPLSFGQQRMWFLDQLEPASVEYLIPLALRLRGQLDVPALRAAMDEVARRHEILRTRYVSAGDDPVQVIDAPGPTAFAVVRAEDEADARTRLHAASSAPFDLATEHPLRVTVIEAGPDDHFVAITLHHIVFDAWSMGIFLRDLDAAYRAAVAGEPSPLVPPSVQYADFAVWQRDQDVTDQLDYWRGQLAGLDPLELPADRPRPAVRDPRGETFGVDVPAEVGAAVIDLGNRLGATPFMTLLAAFEIVLARYTGRTDIAVGTPVAGRTHEEMEDVLGFFVNNLVLRNDLSGDPAFGELLGRVRQVCLDAFARQDVQFEHLVDALSPERDLSRNPLFQIMFEVQNLEGFPRELGEAVIEPVRSGTEVAKFDLTLTAQQRDNGRLRLVFEYATSLFDRATIERLSGHYLRLLAGIDADRPISELDMIPAVERQALLADWPDPDGGRVSELDPSAEHHLTVPELIERRARETPDAVAVVSGTDEITYADLNARSNRLAHHLRKLGVGPETVVGSCLERSPEAVVCLLGVLKAGGVYVPFDPAHPADRLAFMLADAGVRVVVTSAAFLDRLASDEHPVVDIAAAEGPETDLEPLVTPDNLAYIIYTSGSTGRPKGVMIEHRSYAHHCKVIADAYGITAADRVVLLSAMTFDVAMDQIAATLAAGATIVVSDHVFWTPADLPARLAEHGVTIVEITPAYYRAMMESDVSGLTGLKLMNVGSDVVTVADARRWAETGLPGRFLCNYGPTEATVTCVLHPVSGDLPGERAEATMPIGKPVPGTRGYIVDADLRPVPLGVPGELCLGGIRLARGYHARPELTAAQFVPDPFSAEPGARLYRTGDLVRYRPDGAIEFLGRIDQQVKVRGYRIELGEIEAALTGHSSVRAVAVVAREVRPGDRQLVAYLVTDGQPDVPALRAHLRDALPEYMIPTQWVGLAELPLTPSKKVDRKALPDPTVTESARAHVAPRNPTEAAVAAIWADVLGVERVGADDNFFELGGHSLMATRVLSRLREAFAIDLPLRALFEALTVAEVAEAVTEAIEADIASLSDEEIAELLAGDGVS
ncbi:non-ribosomal peptide synthetase [Actinokineospora xionganensis]|uniref:Amino acid adenylation domain-containing protein n=1 Tax=Actinokineospora xionganensis TaxID=2684470 RepID=A0ABR7LBW9_9PSEU|nr:non-ribosomal peptide synthetase [Actinokineospora xionganensis]MBC6450152.1 amino acid adenylation domain-containing protein [Actinokineospora xionganensis]